jgi:hypothetical protein
MGLLLFIISVRPDLRSLCFVAFRKDTVSNKWFQLNDSLPIPQGIMLPNYKPPTSITLPPAIVEPAAIAGPDSMDTQVVLASAQSDPSDQQPDSHS